MARAASRPSAQESAAQDTTAATKPEPVMMPSRPMFIMPAFSVIRQPRPARMTMVAVPSVLMRLEKLIRSVNWKVFMR